MGKNDFDDEDYAPRPRRSERRRSETSRGFSLAFGGVFGCLLAVIVLCICAVVGCVALIRTAKVANQANDGSKNGSSEKPLVVAKPGVPISVQAVTVTIKEILVDKVPLVDFRGNNTTSQDVCTKIVLVIKNNSQTRKVDYRTWRGRFLADSTFKDNLGNSYKGIDFGISKIFDASENSESIHPGEKILDVLVFERPIDKAATFTLELKGANIGATEDLKIQINKSDFRNFKFP